VKSGSLNPDFTEKKFFAKLSPKESGKGKGNPFRVALQE